MRQRADVHVLLCVAAGVAMLLAAGCEIGGARTFSVIPGPTVPSAHPTAAPFVWDAREELDIWVNNPVTRGPVPVSLVGEGVDAFIRIEPRRGSDGWLLRGPDLDPPAAAARTLRIWYRWRLDPTLSPNASRTFGLWVIFEALNPPRPPDQPGDFELLQPESDWTIADFSPGFAGAPLDVKYVYLHQFSSNAGVFELDRIELVRVGGSF